MDHHPVSQNQSPKAIIIGATSGIGRAVAEKFSREGYEVGLTGRRTQLLEKLQSELSTRSYLKTMDLQEPEISIQKFEELWTEMGGASVVVINSGVGNPSDSWELEREVIAVNVTGFTAIAQSAFNLSAGQGGGHIVGISSVASVRGMGTARTYSASKAYMATYMEAMGQDAILKGAPIHLTECKLGFVSTAMTKDLKNTFWMVSPDVAADGIYEAVLQKKRVAFVPGRWKIVGTVMKLVPDWMFFSRSYTRQLMKKN